MNYPQRPLGDVLELDRDRVPVQPEETYPIAGVYGFGRGLFAREAIRGTHTQYKHLHRLRSDMLVLSKLKAFEGALTLVAPKFNDHFLSPEFPTFTIDQTQADIRYIANLCRWPVTWKLLAGKSTGIGSRRERVSPASFLATKVPLPDLSEQRRVATKLDAAAVKLDEISRLRIVQSQKAVALRDAMLNRASERVPLGKLLMPESDLVRVESSEKYQTVGIYSYGRGLFKKTQVTGSETSYSTLNRLHAGQFIFSKLFAWEGALATVTDEFEGCFASSEFPTFSVRKDRVDMRYLAHVVRWPRLHNSLRSETTGMGSRRQRVNVKNMLKAEIPLPSSQAEQRRIASMLDMAESIPTQRSLAKNDYLKDIRVSLLNAAFTGRL